MSESSSQASVRNAWWAAGNLAARRQLIAGACLMNAAQYPDGEHFWSGVRANHLRKAEQEALHAYADWLEARQLGREYLGVMS